MNQKIKGVLSLLLATVIWGGAFVAQSAGMELIGPFTFQTVRCFLAALALLASVLLMDIRNVRQFAKKWADPKLWKTGIICGLALFVSTSLQQLGLVTTDAGKAGFITALYIIFVPLLGVFLKRRPSPAAIVSVLIAIPGMYLLCGTGMTGMQSGDLLLIGCAIAFAVQITLIDSLGQGMDPLRLNCVQALVVATLSAVPALIWETPDVGLILDCWLPLGYAGVLSMGAAYSLQIIGQQRVDSTPAALIMSLESVFAALFGALLLHETMSPTELTGCILMFVAVILSQIHIPIKKKTSR